MPSFDRSDAFAEAILNGCAPELQQQIDQEVRHLARTFAPDGDSASLDAAADALDEGAVELGHARRRVLLWAAGFRRLARDATGRPAAG